MRAQLEQMTKQRQKKFSLASIQGTYVACYNIIYTSAALIYPDAREERKEVEYDAGDARGINGGRAQLIYTVSTAPRNVAQCMRETSMGQLAE